MKISEFVKERPSAGESVKLNDTNWFEKDINLFPHRISDREKETIYRQLNVLQKSGVDIRTAFEILINQSVNKKTVNKLTDALNQIIKGKTISEAFASLPDFTAYEIFSLKIGEETGRLSLVFEKLYTYYENKIAQRRQVISAISYPILIVLTSFGAVTFMVLFIVPMFEEVFLKFNNELPALTRTVIGISKVFKSKIGYFALIIATLIGLNLYFKTNIALRTWKEKLVLRIPNIGTIYKYIHMARFCDAMGLLINSSVPLLTALDMVKKMIYFVHLELVIEEMKSKLLSGASFSHSIQDVDLFDGQMKSMLKVGEEVNQLGPFFEKLALDYTNNVKHRTGLLSTFLEPLLIIFLGLVVGLILVAMYLPMFELSSGMDFGG